MALEPKQVQCQQGGESLLCTWEAGKPRKETPGTIKGQYTIYHPSKPISLFLVSLPRYNFVLNSVARKVLLKPSSSHIALLFPGPLGVRVKTSLLIVTSRALENLTASLRLLLRLPHPPPAGSLHSRETDHPADPQNPPSPQGL